MNSFPVVTWDTNHPDEDEDAEDDDWFDMDPEQLVSSLHSKISADKKTDEECSAPRSVYNVSNAYSGKLFFSILEKVL